ncbi:MAG: hypothetical protein ACRDTZ_23180, partial [Pseudonocardiaceae bacterium]
ALTPVLGDTYHLLVYQEQVVAAAVALAGYTAAQGDLLRKAMGKKKPEILAREGEKFAAGMAENGFGAEATKVIWNAMVPFAAYAFNRCVTGDTEVWLSATNSTFNGRVTVEDLYRRLYVNLLPPRLKNSPSAYSGPCLHCESEGRPAVWRGRCKACKSWINKFRHAGTSALSLCADGRVRIRRIQDVHFNGMRECFEIELADGRKISATANHRHMTAQGWRRVDQLSVGDALLVVAEEMLKSYQRYDYRLSRGEPIYAGARLPNDQRKRENALRYVDGGSMRLEEWTATQIKECQAPGCMRSHNRGDRIERAHLDGDRTNNDSSNLRMFCVSHHKTWDYANNGRLRRWQAGKPTNPVEIIAIRPVGARPVYDLEMTTDNTETDGPERSWVGNGIITHNSHACSYGMLAYWTAYLKTHYPSEYMAALLTSVSDDKDKTAVYLAEARRLGIKVLPPDVNASGERFAATSEGVRFGLGAVR